MPCYTFLLVYIIHLHCNFLESLHIWMIESNLMFKVWEMQHEFSLSTVDALELILHKLAGRGQ
jgi:hypothetical protein